MDNKKIMLTTFYGHVIDPFDPKPEQIDILDIAHALSNICRWNGHVNKFFSVAQHSIYVSYLCDPQDALIGLLHDATEAYLGDLINPIKYMGSMEEYITLEEKFTLTIAKYFNLPSLQKTQSVEDADLLMLGKEAMELGRNVPSKCKPLLVEWKGILDIMKWEVLSPQDAKERFLQRYYEIT